jgi:hypothetical protein
MHFLEYRVTEGLPHFNRGLANLREFWGFALPTAPFESCLHQVLFLGVFLRGVQHAVYGFDEHVNSYHSNSDIGVDFLMKECQSRAVFNK